LRFVTWLRRHSRIEATLLVRQRLLGLFFLHGVAPL
jgi:hypothetical protein